MQLLVVPRPLPSCLTSYVFSLYFCQSFQSWFSTESLNWLRSVLSQSSEAVPLQYFQSQHAAQLVQQTPWVKDGEAPCGLGLLSVRRLVSLN